MPLWIAFDWDPQKEKTNYEKHGILFSQAIEAFADPHRLVECDERHSKTEERYYCYGKVGDRIMTVRFTPRGDSIRIFGAAYWREGKKKYDAR